MSNEIDWSKAPEGAGTYELHLRGGFNRFCKQGMWFSEHDKVWYVKTDNADWQIIATRPDESERKTVKDAVEYYGGKWPDDKYNHIAYNLKMKAFKSTLLKCGVNEHWHQVCTRAEFEAEVERQKGEQLEYNQEEWDELCGIEQEWTHTASGHKCHLVNSKTDYNGCVPIFVEGYGYDVVLRKDLKPIKPIKTISKAEAYDRITEWFENEDSQLSKESFWKHFQRINEVV